jgi:hypothetical protein
MPEDTTAETAAVTTTETTTETTTAAEKATPPPELKAIIDKERQNARDAEKARKALEKELQELRQQSMTDQEKAIESARTEARTAAFAEMGGKIAAAEIRAAAAGRLAPEQLDVLLDGINVSRFLDDTGEVDRTKVQTFIDGIAPQPAEQTHVFPDLGQGARGAAAMALNGDPLEQALKAKLGIR